MHAWVSDEYINFASIYTTDNILPVIPINPLVYQDGEPTTSHKLATGMKPSSSNLCILLCLCVLLKTTVHVDIKTLNMCHQSHKTNYISSLEFHNNKQGTSNTYLVQRK